MSTNGEVTKDSVTYEARAAFVDGVMIGADWYASVTGDPKHNNPFLQTLYESIDFINDAFDHAKKARERKAEKQPLIGQWVAPKFESNPYHHAWKYGIYRFKVEDVAPSGTGDIECAEGVLVLSQWWKQGRVPGSILVAADQWAISG